MATIKISELSVGDWVQDNYGNYSKVEGIWQGRNFSYQVDCNRDGVIGTIDPCNIHPIPITPEMLEANGWKLNEEDEYMEYYGDPTSSIAHTKGTYHYRLEVPEVSAVCYFVHQLQHALRLAGVDKEIVIANK